METQLEIVGICLIALGLVHAIFPKQFNWKQELSALSALNREMMYVHTFFIAVVLVLVGLLCCTSAGNLIGGAFGKRISLGCGIFFFLRLLVQFFGYSSKTWKGKGFETVVHILFSIFWTYVTALFLIAYAF